MRTVLADIARPVPTVGEAWAVAPSQEPARCWDVMCLGSPARLRGWPAWGPRAVSPPAQGCVQELPGKPCLCKTVTPIFKMDFWERDEHCLDVKADFETPHGFVRTLPSERLVFGNKKPGKRETSKDGSRPRGSRTTGGNAELQSLHHSHRISAAQLPGRYRLARIQEPGSTSQQILAEEHSPPLPPPHGTCRSQSSNHAGDPPP